MKRTIIRSLIILSIIVINVGCDQVSKSIVRHNIHFKQSIRVVDSFVTLTNVENKGAFLSLGDSLGTPLRILLLLLMPIFGLGYGLLLVFRKKDIRLPMLIGICFVIGGGIGNLFDRLVHGSVTDFLHINFVIFQTGIFNMADVSIMVGLFLILIESTIYYRGQGISG